MSKDESDRDKDRKKEEEDADKKKEEEGTFTQGVVEGFVETLVSPFKWFGKMLG
jgi:hypothetical protein